MTWLERKVVLVPFDFSPDSRGAVDVGLEIVGSTSGLHILHVLPLLTPTEPAFAYYDLPNDQSRREATEKSLREQFGDDKYRAVQMAVTFGDPGQEIAKYAEQIKADLIVLPSHGRTGLKRLLIGSVAERVCRLAHCPVLVLRK
jgi:nucleotide-binding universal stress UspA family protein